MELTHTCRIGEIPITNIVGNMEISMEWIHQYLAARMKAACDTWNSKHTDDKPISPLHFEIKKFKISNTPQNNFNMQNAWFNRQINDNNSNPVYILLMLLKPDITDEKQTATSKLFKSVPVSVVVNNPSYNVALKPFLFSPDAIKMIPKNTPQQVLLKNGITPNVISTLYSLASPTAVKINNQYRICIGLNVTPLLGEIITNPDANSQGFSTPSIVSIDGTGTNFSVKCRFNSNSSYTEFSNSDLIQMLNSLNVKSVL